MFSPFRVTGCNGCFLSYAYDVVYTLVVVEAVVSGVSSFSESSSGLQLSLPGRYEPIKALVVNGQAPHA